MYYSTGPLESLASYPGSFLWRKEPGNIGGAEPFTSATSSFMWFPLGTPHFGAIITQFLEGHVRMIYNISSEKATERIRRVRRHWLLSVKTTNFKTWEPGNLRTVFKTGKLQDTVSYSVAIHVKFKSYQQLSLPSVSVVMSCDYLFSSFVLAMTNKGAGHSPYARLRR